MEQEAKKVVSAKPLFDTLQGRGAMAAFAKKLNISLPRLMNWKTRGIPANMVRDVAHAMSLPTSDDYFRLAESGQKIPTRGFNGAKRHIPHSEAEKLLALVKTFLDTDAEGQLEILEAAISLTESHAKTGTESPGGKRRSRRR